MPSIFGLRHHYLPQSPFNVMTGLVLTPPFPVRAMHATADGRMLGTCDVPLGGGLTFVHDNALSSRFFVFLVRQIALDYKLHRTCSDGMLGGRCSRWLVSLPSASTAEKCANMILSSASTAERSAGSVCTRGRVRSLTLSLCASLLHLDVFAVVNTPCMSCVHKRAPSFCNDAEHE